MLVEVPMSRAHLNQPSSSKASAVASGLFIYSLKTLWPRARSSPGPSTALGYSLGTAVPAQHTEQFKGYIILSCRVSFKVGITEMPCQRKDNPVVGETLGSTKTTSRLAAVAETVMS